MSNVTVTLPKPEYDALIEFREQIEKGMILVSDPNERYMYYENSNNELEFIGTEEALVKMQAMHDIYEASIKAFDNSKLNTEIERCKINDKRHAGNIENFHIMVEDREATINKHVDTIIKRDETIMLMETSWKSHSDKLKARWWKIW